MGVYRSTGICNPNVLERVISEPKVQGEKEKGRKKRKEGVTVLIENNVEK